MSCHSPCGECGLKFDVMEIERGYSLSLPMRGVWIEITAYAGEDTELLVTPHAGSVD